MFESIAHSPTRVDATVYSPVVLAILSPIFIGAYHVRLDVHETAVTSMADHRRIILVHDGRMPHTGTLFECRRRRNGHFTLSTRCELCMSEAHVHSSPAFFVRPKASPEFRKEPLNALLGLAVCMEAHSTRFFLVINAPYLRRRRGVNLDVGLPCIDAGRFGCIVAQQLVRLLQWRIPILPCIPTLQDPTVLLVLAAYDPIILHVRSDAHHFQDHRPGMPVR